MPVAICNTCLSLVPYKTRLKDQHCKCGSNNLTAVAGTMAGNGWNYHDRKGNFKIYVPRDTFQPLNPQPVCTFS